MAIDAIFHSIFRQVIQDRFSILDSLLVFEIPIFQHAIHYNRLKHKHYKRIN